MTEHEYLAVEPLPDDESLLLRECEDGHTWVEQPDGTVSPSWGYGGTHVTWDGYDPATCPEPRRAYSLYTDDDGEPTGPMHGYKCPTCGTVNYAGSCSKQDGTFAGQMRGDVCDAPPPVCLKPVVRTARWMRVKKLLARERKGKEAGTYDYKPGWTATWVPLEESGAPDVREREPRQLTLEEVG